jgi:hypothetical protein
VKQLFALPMILLLLALSGIHCHRMSIQPPPSVLKGKLVVNGPCGFYAVEVISGNIDSTKIQKTWEYLSGKTDSVYRNVFRVSDLCVFGGYGLSKNDTFSFELTDSVIVQDCMICQIAWPGGLNVMNTVVHVRRQ